MCFLVRPIGGKGFDGRDYRTLVSVIQNPLPIGKSFRRKGSLINFPTRIARKGKAQPTGNADAEEALVSIESHFYGKYTGGKARFAIRRNTYFHGVGQGKGRAREGTKAPQSKAPPTKANERRE